MAMSKKDYQALARAIYTARVEMLSRKGPDGTLDTLDSVAGHVALHLAADNPRFDRARFIEACETGTTKGMPKRERGAA